ncbi:MAG: hypothetical protein OEZ59_12280 [Deltaproteobacteria bacterium]|nr:hypothetical protein [Deltaproteobacteria bacterium]
MSGTGITHTLIGHMPKESGIHYLSFPVSLLLIRGDLPGVDMSVFGAGTGLDLGRYFITQDHFAIGGYTGFSYSTTTTRIKVNGEALPSSSSRAVGLKLGGQVLIQAGPLMITPFYTMESGKVKTSTQDINGKDVDISSGYSSSTYGLDLLHNDSGITLSAIMQQMKDSEEPEGVDIQIIQLSILF